MPGQTPLVRRFSQNLLGRDFLVADIHGCFHLLYEALSRVGFNPERDRLFIAGDLTDRGPYSAAAQLLLSYPWAHACRGNHEQLLLDCYADGDLDEAMLAYNIARNGMGWWRETPLEQQQAILAQFASLPFAMEVETGRGRVGIVHAEVPTSMDWPTFISQLEQGDQTTMTCALWSRDRVHGGRWRKVAGIGRVYSGHTPQFDGVLQLGNCVFCDTGAVFEADGYPGQLSLLDLTVDESTLRRRPPGVIAIYDQATTRPF